MTPERLAEIRSYLAPTGCGDDQYRTKVEQMARDLLAWADQVQAQRDEGRATVSSISNAYGDEIARLRSKVAAVEALVPAFVADDDWIYPRAIRTALASGGA